MKALHIITGLSFLFITTLAGRDFSKPPDQTELAAILLQQVLQKSIQPCQYDLFLLNIRHDLISYKNIYRSMTPEIEVSGYDSTGITISDEFLTGFLLSADLAYLLNSDLIIKIPFCTN